MQNLVKQGDTLLQICFQGLTVKVNEDGVIVALQQLFRGYLVKNSGELPQHRHPPPSVDLYFGGMRSLLQLQIEEEVGMLEGTGCEVLPCSATTDNISALA